MGRYPIKMPVLGGAVKAPSQISLLIYIKSMIEVMLDIEKRRFGVDLPNIHVKGIKRAQFEEAVRIWGENPRPSMAAVRRRALKRFPGTKDDPGYDDLNLKRYIESKPEYFPK